MNVHHQNDQSIKQVNRLVLAISAALNAVLLAGYALEVFRGSISPFILLGCVVIVGISLIGAFFVYRNSPASSLMRLFTAVGSVVLMAYALLISPSPEVYAIALVLPLPYILYFDSGFIAGYGIAMLIANLGSMGISFQIKPDYYAYSSSGVTIHVAASIGHCITLYFLTRLATSLNSEKMEQIAQVAAQQQGTLGNVMQIAGSIQANTQHSEMIGEQLNDHVQQVSQLLGDISGTVMQRGEAVVVQMQDSTERLKSDTETAVGTMRSLQDACGRIATATQLISSIAMQTNILSLNAGVESARVGEAGKGFAVVADEVKQLAEKSMQSAQEIGHIIELLQTEANQAMLSMERVNEVTNQIGEVSANSRAVFSEIGEHISEVHQLVHEVTTSVNEVTAANHSLSLEVEQMVVNDGDETPRQLPAQRRRVEARYALQAGGEWE